MKHIKSILILLILVGLPLGSWYFLSRGLEWRKSKVSDLKAKELFLKAYDFSDEDKNRLYELMAHRTTIVKLHGAINDNDIAIINQFENAYTFQFLSFEKTDGNSKTWSSKSAARFYKPSSQNAIPATLKDCNYVIVDTAGFIRQCYEGDSEQMLGLLVEDTAVVLPRKKPKDIGIKKSNADKE